MDLHGQENFLTGQFSPTLNVAESTTTKGFTSRYSDNRKLQGREHTQNQDNAIGSTVFHEARKSVNFC